MKHIFGQVTTYGGRERPFTTPLLLSFVSPLVKALVPERAIVKFIGRGVV
jgi:hypothetical protein